MVPVEPSVSTRGWRIRRHKMIHNGKTAENPLVTIFFVKEHCNFSLKPKVLDPQIPSETDLLRG